MKEKKTICFIAGTLQRGGAEKQFYLIIQILLQKEYKVKLIYFANKKEYWHSPLEKLGVEVFIIQLKNRLRRLLELKEISKKFKFDYVQAIHFYMNPYVLFFSIFNKAIPIGSFRGDGKREIKTVPKFVNFFSFLFLKKFISNSKITIEHLNKNYFLLKNKIKYVPNIVSVSSDNILKRDFNDYKFLYVGSIKRLKRLDLTLKFFKEFNFKHIKSSLTIVGDGNLKKEAEKFVINNNLSEKVLFEGHCIDTKRYYKKCNFFIFSSESEGTPNVILEALSNGLIVLTSSVGEVCEIIKNKKNGLILDFNDKKQIKESINFIIGNNDNLNLISKNAKSSINKFTKKNVAKILDQIYV